MYVSSSPMSYNDTNNPRAHNYVKSHPLHRSRNYSILGRHTCQPDKRKGVRGNWLIARVLCKGWLFEGCVVRFHICRGRREGVTERKIAYLYSRGDQNSSLFIPFFCRSVDKRLPRSVCMGYGGFYRPLHIITRIDLRWNYIRM